jgi:virginiamycin B lyase
MKSTHLLNIAPVHKRVGSTKCRQSLIHQSKTFFLYLSALSVVSIAVSARLPAQEVAVIQRTLSGSSPTESVVGPDGALWFTEQSAKIGRFTKAGTLTEYPIPNSNPETQGITNGPDGALWFAESKGNNIGRITTAGVVTEYPLPEPGSGPYDITTGPDGALWFTEHLGNRIGRITTSGAITEYPIILFNEGAGPEGITTGPDGALWFAENQASQIASITTGGMITQYFFQGNTFPYPVGIASGPDGALWFTNSNTGSIGRITTEGTISLYDIPGGGAPGGIVSGPEGDLWFTNQGFTAVNPGYIGRITTSGTITQFPTLGASPTSVASGPGGALWYVSGYPELDAIGQVVFPTSTLTLNPASAKPGDTATLTGSGFGPSEHVKLYSDGTTGLSLVKSVIADATGSFSLTEQIAAVSGGTNETIGTGETSGKFGVAVYNVEPRLTISPNSGPAGTAATVKGYGYPAGTPVFVFVPAESDTPIGTAETDANGSFTVSVTIPQTAPGVDVIYGGYHGDNRAAGVDFTVE